MQKYRNLTSRESLFLKLRNRIGRNKKGSQARRKGKDSDVKYLRKYDFLLFHFSNKPSSELWVLLLAQEIFDKTVLLPSRKVPRDYFRSAVCDSLLFICQFNFFRTSCVSWRISYFSTTLPRRFSYITANRKRSLPSITIYGLRNMKYVALVAFSWSFYSRFLSDVQAKAI